MSLTIFVDSTMTVGVVEWLKDRRFNITYPTSFSAGLRWDDFRRTGYDLVNEHFVKYEGVRVDEGDSRDFFNDAAGRKYLRVQRPVAVSLDVATRETVLSPLSFRSYSLGGLVSLDKAYQRRLKQDASEEEFWRAFDEVLAEAG